MKEEGKLGAMVLMIVSRCGSRRNLDRAMLCRLCYFSDFGHRGLHRESISGSAYVIGAGGPEPESLDSVIRELSRMKALKVTYRRGSESYALPTAPDLSLLSDSERECIENVIGRYGGMSERLLSWQCRNDANCQGRRISERVDYVSAPMVAAAGD